MLKINKIVKPVTTLIALAAILSLPIKAEAGQAPYTSLTYDKDGYLVNTMDGYLPEHLWDKFGEETLSKPSDLFLAGDRLYIADTGNKRIVCSDLNGNYLGEITEELKSPTGVYVSQEGLVYVADPGAGKIISYDADWHMTGSYERPESPLFGDGAKYAPSKLVVNNAGTMYALSEGNAGGIMTISDNGDFYGYFGANDTSISLGNKLKRLIFTDEQLRSMQKNVPASAANLDIDATGLIYTVTQGLGKNGLKKYNMAGNNMFGKAYADLLVSDVAVGDIDNIFTLSKQGSIMEYTKEGELLFYFGGKDDGNNRMGLFINAVAIDVDASGHIYVLDSDRGDITVFSETEYATTVHEALSKYQDGLYLESRQPWENVLSHNSLFDFAYRGIAKALYKVEDYKGSMEAARLGGTGITYSNAFWQVRNTWLRHNIVRIFEIIIAFLIVSKILKRFGDRLPLIRDIRRSLGRIRDIRTVRELRFLGYVLKNPADAFYGIKREKKVSLSTASLLYLIIFIIYLVNRYYCGFIFKTVADGEYDLLGDFIKVPGVMLLFVICINMICSIRDGEATLRQTYISFAYCFMPYVFLKPVAFVLSHVLTYNEEFLITFLNFIMTAGTLILIVVMIREIQCFSYKETFINILLALFTMLVIVAAGVIIFGLFKQVVDFVISICKEGYYRGI
ncbi:YIP1 family protein [Butyrivibrio sp. MC2013]|uniref:YIP1 family protein n=1 Tax=Butyrivibrio sp. MC2013 TaxID=1280686 RepID=UPI0003FFEBAC|nr:YIP1 family protein [Butyrivibrio sp. MC2013]